MYHRPKSSTDIDIECVKKSENVCSNLKQYFLKDAISSECSVKRRCSASNVMTLIEHARRPDVMSKHALTLCLGKIPFKILFLFSSHCSKSNFLQFNLLDNFAKDFTLNTIVGSLGLLRILLPKILLANPLDTCVVHKMIEIYEICLHLLNDTNHTVINASLECLCVILINSKPQLTNILNSDQLTHMEILCKKRSLKNQIFRRKSSATSLDASVSKNQLNSPKRPTSPAKQSTANTPMSVISRELDESDASNVLDFGTIKSDDKGLLTGSDVELDSLRLNDFELCQSNESLVQLSATNSPSVKKSAHESTPLKTQKSTDSIGSFLNNLMHTNTGKLYHTL